VPFDDVLGQPLAKRLLSSALRSGRLAHAYLFHGPSGVGKVTAARSLFRAALCPRAPWEGCSACPTCSRVDRGSHADVHYLFVPPGKRSLPVEDVRNLVAETGRKPVEGGSRFFLIDEAHLLGEESASALLKTLEEPPARTVLVLTALRAEAVLRTVRSRCQPIRFSRLEESLVREALLERRAARDDAEARAAARLAEGSLGDAIHLSAAGFVGARSRVAGALLDAAGGRAMAGAAAVLGVAEDLSRDAKSREEKREAIRAVLRIVSASLRDAALLASGAAGDSESTLLLPDMRGELERLAERLGPARASEGALRSLQAADLIRQNLREELVVESAFLSLARAATAPASVL